MIGKTIGPYEVIGKLGEGGMGEVYRSTDTKLKRDIALKVLPPSVAADPDRLARFRREAEVLASLNHPNIAAIYGFEDSTSVKALVMELVDGPTLADRIGRGPIPLDEAVPIARQIAEALEAAHERGIIHRDLKPANVKVRPDGTVKVLDFGLAKASAPGGPTPPGTSDSPTITTPAMTEAGVILGTASYMSPEQARGKPIDKRADIWAFGVVLSEMLTGRRLFAGDSTLDVLTAVLRQPIDVAGLPADTPARLRRLLRRCLERDPKQRLHDIADVRLDLDDLAGSSDESAVTPAGPPRSNRTAMIGWAVGLAGIGIAGVVLLGGGAPAATAVEYRFTVPQPGTGANPPVISPDGRHLVYDTGSRLLLRALDEAEPRRIDGTDGGREPFWSPDGQSIGFFTDAELKRVSIAGGRPTVLAPITQGWPTGTWSSTGAILVEVTENPGNEGWYLLDPGATSLRKIKAFARDRPINPDKALPSFLPDGEHFLFTHPVGTVATLQVGSIRSDETRLLVPADTRGTYAAGHVLYVRDGTLFAQRFDPASLTLAGDPVAVLDDIDYFSPTGEAHFSVSRDGTLVYRHTEAGSDLRWFDREGRETGRLLDRGIYHDTSLSDDGTRLAVSIRDPRRSTRDIWTVDVERNVPTRLTSSPRSEMRPVYSPDGRRLVFSTDWEGPPNLYIADASGGQPRVLVPFDRTQQFAGGWTPDGASVVYSKRTETFGLDIWVVDVLTGNRRPVLETAFNEWQPTVSPNGRWLAYASNASGPSEIYLRDFPDGGWEDRISVGGGIMPNWRRDGRELFYYEPGGAVVSVAIEAGSTGRPRVSRPTPLFTVDDSRFRSFAVAPDGQRFLLNLTDAGGLVPPDSVIVNWTRLIRD